MGCEKDKEQIGWRERDIKREKKTEWRGKKKEKIKITEIKILKIEERDKKPNKNWTRWRKVVKKNMEWRKERTEQKSEGSVLNGMWKR